MKVVSGILLTGAHEQGRVVIDLSRNEIVEGDLTAADLRQERIVATDPDLRTRYFDGTPCYTVGLREIRTSTIDRDDFGARPPIESSDEHGIDSSVTGTRLTVNWFSTGNSRVKEITYLVIGPVSANPSGPR